MRTIDYNKYADDFIETTLHVDMDSICQSFEKFNATKGKQKLKELKPIPMHLTEKPESNEEMMNKYSFYATSILVWKNAQGALETAKGLLKDLKSVFE